SIQEIEYLRSYLLGRMAWSKINGLIIVSGGIGLFDREVAIGAGGYDHKSFGEDMELTVRMRKYMHEIGQKYIVKYIPESLCWTEVPPTLDIFMKQRVRWAKGLVQTLFKHREMWFNPKFGRMGLLSFPYWILYEWLAPVIELVGLISYSYLIYTGKLNFEYSLLLLAFVFFFSVMITTISILWEEYTNQVYKTKTEIFKLLMVIFLEPFLFHPIVVYASIKGNIALLFGIKNAWGNMGRMGVDEEEPVKALPEAIPLSPPILKAS
ncbi:MAG: glycosyltransferase family 2 protein, partial [Flavobacterium sp.]|nr:glycosyltransferase family 2 protein [Pedobacter sp.]